LVKADPDLIKLQKDSVEIFSIMIQQWLLKQTWTSFPTLIQGRRCKLFGELGQSKLVQDTEEIDLSS